MTIGVTIVDFVIKEAKLVQMIVCYHIIQSTGLSSTHCQSKKAATKFSFLTFPHQTAVISRAKSRSPCFQIRLYWFPCTRISIPPCCFPQILAFITYVMFSYLRQLCYLRYYSMSSIPRRLYYHYYDICVLYMT